MQLHVLLGVAAMAAGAAANPGAAMTTTAPATLNTGCSSLRAITESCKSATPSFTELRGFAQASCLCSGGSGSGSGWDSAASECLAWAETAHPSIAHSLLDDGAVGFCSLVAQATSALGPIVPGTAAPTAAFTYPACHSLDAIVQSCASATSSFADLRGAVQVSCLCGGGGGDSGWDAAARSCYDFARTAHPNLAAILTDVHAVGACAAVRTGPAAAASTAASTTPAAGNSTVAATTSGSSASSAASTGSSAATSMPTSTASASSTAKNAAVADAPSSLHALWSSLGALIVGFFVLG